MIKITFLDETFDQIAEFRKFTASLLTPTIKSKIAKTKSSHTPIKYILSIV